MADGRPPGPNRARDPLTRAVLDALDRNPRGTNAWLAKRAGIGRNEISRWRMGTYTPSAYALWLVMEAAGLGFEIIDNRMRIKSVASGSRDRQRDTVTKANGAPQRAPSSTYPNQTHPTHK